MKILICYHSQTGNTEKVARAMEDALTGQDVTLAQAGSVPPTSLTGYDLVLLGSGVYGGGVGASIKTLMKQATTLPPRFALFSTHESTNPGMYKDAFKLVRKALEKGGSRIIGEFDSLGENKIVTPERKREVLASMPPERRLEVQDAMKNLEGRPNAEDLDNARMFVRGLMNLS